MRHDVIEVLELLAQQLRLRGGVGITLHDIEQMISILAYREKQAQYDLDSVRSLDAGQS